MIFNDFNWHDSIIKNITIDRNKPGIIDIINFEIEWADGGKAELVFEDTYWANLTLNFGIVADETILSACMGDDKDPDLIDFYSRWKGLMDNINLNSYLIRLNSTGGIIKIIAKGFIITDK
jgi:hypothetical protein